MIPYHHCLGQVFLSVAETHAEQPALRMWDGEVVSYRQLADRACRIAALLEAEGVGRRDVVALQNGKSPDGYGAMLACLMLGVAYVNLDEGNPADRLARILATCRPKLLVADAVPAASIAEACARQGVRLLRLEGLDRFAAVPPAGVGNVSGGLPAYLMFTSGSTGFPKGVAIAHSSVLNFIAWSRETFGVGPGEVLTNVNPIYFDNSVFDVFSALFTGACLAPIPAEVTRDARRLVEAVRAAGCTLWFSVPSLLIYLVTMKALTPDALPTLRQVVFGGEGYPVPELAKLRRLLGEGVRLVNVYGPTECTCICSAYEVTAADLAAGQGLPPLGTIARNFDWLVLDDDKPAATGELCLLGPQVGLGYINDPERTRAAFVANPLNSGWHEPMYRTGDLVRQEGGLLWFVGRKDNQIKHQGYRIELEEIEAALQKVPGVVQAAVVYRRVAETHGHLIGFVASPEALSEEGLRAALKSALPDYMIPNRFEISPELPKNANGKVDRARLRDG